MPSARLVRVLGAGVGLAVGVGTTIGAGILGAPSDVAHALPDARLILAVWVAGAVYALIGANSMAEVATIVARSGGFTPIARRTLGSYAGFAVGFIEFAASCGSIAAQALALADNAAVLMPSLAGKEPFVAAAVIAALSALQWRGVEVGARAQVVMSIVKAAAFLALVAACFFVPAAAPATTTATTTSTLPSGVALAAAFAVALQGVIFTYDGWYSAIYIGEEVKDPGRAIPRSLFSTVIAVAALYVLINAALLFVLPADALGATKTPFADVAGILVGGSANKVIAGVIVISLTGALNATLLGTPRVLFSMAKDGVVPAPLVATTEGGTPSAALLLTVVAALLFVAFGQTFKSVIDSLSVLMVAMYTSVFLGLLVLRKREPDGERPFRARCYPWLTLLGLALSLAFLIGVAVTDTVHAELGAVVVVVTVPLYFLQRWFKGRTPPTSPR